MNKSLIAIILIASIGIWASPVAAQTENDSLWSSGGNIGLFLQQVGVSNWSGGGQNAISYGAETTLFLNRANDKSTWESSLFAAYALIKQGDQETWKNNDALIITSKYGRFFTKKLQLSAGLDFRTQFADGFDYEGANDGTDTLTSAFMAPGYLSLYVGATYKPNKALSVTLAPVTNKLTFVLDDQLAALGAYGVDRGDNVRSQMGASLTASFQKEVMTNVNIKSNLFLFGAYDDFNHIDVNYDLFINLKVNKFITTNFGLQAIYDHDIDIEDEDGNVGPRLQLRNALTIGFNFNFGDKLEDE